LLQKIEKLTIIIVNGLFIAKKYVRPVSSLKIILRIFLISRDLAILAKRIVMINKTMYKIFETFHT